MLLAFVINAFYFLDIFLSQYTSRKTRHVNKLFEKNPLVENMRYITGMNLRTLQNFSDLSQLRDVGKVEL